ncbi:MAG: FHA domain-containing protein [Thermoplasmatota archaeon]
MASGSCELEFREPDGTRRKISLDGDFHLGRVMIADGPFLSVLRENGTIDRITICSLSVSRLEEDPSGGAERSHARFFWRGDRFFVQDMGSSNGTSLNGIRIRGWSKGKVSEPIEINSRIVVGFGKYEITIEPVYTKDDAGTVDVAGISVTLPGECADLKKVLVESYKMIPDEYPSEIERLFV